MFSISVKQTEAEDKANCVANSFLQTNFWGDFKSLHGWTALYFSFTALQTETQKKYTGTCTVLLRSFLKVFTLSYIPLGPEVETAIPYEEYCALCSCFFEELVHFLPKNTFFARFDLPIVFSSLEEKKDFIKKQKIFTKSTSDIQPPDSVILDLTQDESALLAQMKSKWRYNIRLAEKNSIVVTKENNQEGLDIFYNLYTITSQRDGIALHKKDYYESLFELAKTHSEVAVNLFVARHEDTPLAAIIVLFTKTQAVYLYGASSNEKRNFMPTYLLQWTAIKEAKSRNCSFYDFYGIPPFEDKNHPMYGLYRFKTGFGGKIIHRIGSCDFPIKKTLYSFYRFAEKLRAFWYKKVKKLFVKHK
ncbi:MAG: peptidoglycan bridge formation glycyltransferase FemA/FemB family protein [Spirochaetaceae bacterium]|nr:peptidoglycan bridge formation glycyltransferase FemA/FemB family protein [Spirochaetaceae bacterium]